jgi:hypothetical protein
MDPIQAAITEIEWREPGEQFVYHKYADLFSVDPTPHTIVSTKPLPLPQLSCPRTNPNPLGLATPVDLTGGIDTQPQVSINPKSPVAPVKATVNSSSADSTILSDRNVAGEHIQQ